MAFFKKKMEIAAAMRLALGMLLKRDQREALKEVAVAASMSSEESQLLVKEILLLEVSLWHIRFLEAAQSHRVSIDPNELGRQFGIALMLALRDAGLPDHVLEARGEELIAGMGEYLDDAFAAHEADERGDVFFTTCQLLPRRTLPNLDLRRSEDQDRHFEVFNVAKQVNELQTQVLEALLKEYRLINS